MANPSELYGRKRRKRRNDKLAAEQLARLGRADPTLLCPIRHRGEPAQLALAVVQARDAVVRARSQLISHVRGSVKPFGERLPSCDADAFARRMTGLVPPPLRPALAPGAAADRLVDARAAGYDQAVAQLAAQDAETERARCRASGR